jgi:hypothetical protein
MPDTKGGSPRTGDSAPDAVTSGNERPSGGLSPNSHASAAAPTDDELIKDIEKRVKRKDFDSAFDLARGIQDQDLHGKTVARIDKALAFVTAKAAAK